MISEELIVLTLVSVVHPEFALPAVHITDTAAEPLHLEVITITLKKPYSHRKAHFKEVLQELCYFQSLSSSGKHLQLHVSFNLF